MNEVENKVGQALEYLIAHDSPNLADYVINEGCYIAPIVLGRSRYSTTFEQYIVIDFTRPLIYDTKEWTDYGLVLFNKFNDIKKWYKC